MQQHHKHKSSIKTSEPETAPEAMVGVPAETINPNTTIKSTFPRSFFLLLGSLVVILVGGIAIKLLQFQKKPTVKQITVNKQVIQRRSADLGLINLALTGKAIDVNTGKIVQAARVFNVGDKTVYLELDVTNPPVGTLIDYIRYKEGKYVDHGEITITSSTTNNVLFNWTINKLLAASRNGKWKIATYANGVLAERINYEITNNKVSYLVTDEPSSRTDPEYYLSQNLTWAAKGY